MPNSVRQKSFYRMSVKKGKHRKSSDNMEFLPENTGAVVIMTTINTEGI